jgi:hypothetical protein
MNIHRDCGMQETVICEESKNITHCSLEFGVHKTTVQNVLHNQLRFCMNKIQLIHELKSVDRRELTVVSVK